MTPDYDSMPAGEEMDALVSDIVFRSPVLWVHNSAVKRHPVIKTDKYRETDDVRGTGQAWMRGIDDNGREFFYAGAVYCPQYSTDIADAWKIVEWNMGDCQNSDLFIECWSDGEWFVASHPVGYSNREPTAHCDGKTTGKPSLPLAICRWALKRES